MKYQRTNDKKILGKWKYKIQFSCYFNWLTNQKGINTEQWNSSEEEEIINSVLSYLRNNSVGSWERIGNNFYFDSLTDAFNIRLYFDNDIKYLLEAKG